MLWTEQIFNGSDEFCVFAIIWAWRLKRFIYDDFSKVSFCQMNLQI